MKRKFSKILGVGLTLSLLASLLLTAAPVAADVSDVTVDVKDDTLSKESKYSITFKVNDELSSLQGGTFTVADGTYTTTKVDDQNGTISANLPGEWTLGASEDMIGAYTATGTGALYGDPPTSSNGTTATIDVSGTLSATKITFSGTAVRTLDAFITDDEIFDISGTVDIGSGGVLTADLDGWVTFNDTDYPVTFDITDGSIEAGTISIKFPEDTVVHDVWDNGDVTVQSTAGFGKANPDEIEVDGDVVTIEDPDDVYTVTIGLTQLPNNIGEGATVRVKFLSNQITNPSEPGDYTLKVCTSEEDDYIKSEPYEIELPTVGGGLYIYNASDILVETFGGKTSLDSATDPIDYFSKEDFTIEVGPGTYLLTGDIDITGKGLTLKSSDGMDETEIDCNENYGIIISEQDVTIEGFLINDASIGITIGADDATVKNCEIKDADNPGPGILINEGGTDATISDNVFDACRIAIRFAAMADGSDPVDLDDVDITGNEIEGCDSDTDGIVFGGGNKNIDVTGNTISANEGSGIYFVGDLACNDIMIKGNTISENEEHGIHVNATAAPAKLEISENTIADNETDGILIDQSGEGVWAVTSAIIFNNFSGNDSDHLQNDSDDDVNAYFNWWGSADEDDFEAKIEEKGDGDINYEPWLMAEFPEGVSAGDVKANTSSIDAKDDVGVSITGLVDDTPSKDPALDNAEIICVGKYAANPEEELDDAFAFFDVFVVLEADVAEDEVTARLKFYDSAINTGSVANFWTGDFWVECSDQMARSGVVYVTITEDTIPTLEELEGTPFALVAGPPVEDVFGAPVITAPESGAEDVSLKPTLAWGTVADAIGYDFELADNTLFVMPMVSLTGDMARLITPFYQQVVTLDYSAYYYWRVKAVSADAESGWSSAVFMTMAEPIPEPEPEPRMWICPQCGLTYSTRTKLEAHADWAHQPVEPADIVVVPPDIIVPLPDVAAPITPGWIYAIIGVGAVLVIALLVLIVRTRRVA